jgi:hypothetical protein
MPGSVSTTKLREYRAELSLVTVRDGPAGRKPGGTPDLEVADLGQVHRAVVLEAEGVGAEADRLPLSFFDLDRGGPTLK